MATKSKKKPAKAKAKPAAKAKKTAPKKVAKPAKKVVKKVAPKAKVKSVKKAVKPAPKKAAKPTKKVVVKAKPVKPAKPSKVVKSSKEVKPAKPGKTVVPAKPAKAAVPVKPSKATIKVAEESKEKAAIKQALEKANANKPVIDEDDPMQPEPKRRRGRQPKPKAEGSRPVSILNREVDMAAIAAYVPPIRNLAKPVAIIPTKKVSTDPNKTRYSDKELAEFRTIIIKKIDEAKKELANLQAILFNPNEHGTDDTASSFKMMEDGSDTQAKEEAGQLAARQRKFIEQLENALVRIENKTYGICRVTGKLIPAERLRAVPHTTQSIEAKMQQYRD